VCRLRRAQSVDREGWVMKDERARPELRRHLEDRPSAIVNPHTPRQAVSRSDPDPPTR
jgi:hypothetical protein